MKKKHYYLVITLAVTLSVLAFDSVKRAFFLDTKIAYADPSYTYVYGTDGNEHLALNNFYPKTKEIQEPSSTSGSLGVGYENISANASLSHISLNECSIFETHCESDRNNLCPLGMTGVAVVTPNGQVIQVWNNPF
ncbi:MAG: hypothetical protein IKW84_08165 [Bacteroidaceae bacterium]|nr:hypothetical protein [Bacteroidaceae bacterium]